MAESAGLSIRKLRVQVPSVPPNLFSFQGPVAKRLKHLSLKQGIQGSSPCWLIPYGFSSFPRGRREARATLLVAGRGRACVSDSHTRTSHALSRSGNLQSGSVAKLD